MPNLISNMARSMGLPRLKRAAGVVTRRLPIPQPVLCVGPGSAGRLGRTVGDLGHRKVMLVTNADVVRLGLHQTVLDALTATGTPVVVFDAVTANTPIACVEQGIALFCAQGCDAVVAVGGGSVMGAAKVIALCATNGKHPRKLVGYFKARQAPAPIYAVPTTAGTGSEVTVAAVVSDPAEGGKLMIADTRIVPTLAALDPDLMMALPPAVTAATGMDALTHAIEAHIGGWTTPYTDRMALAAVGMIFKNLPLVCHDGGNRQAREQMALASCFAGLAFTRANVGNVHAISHQLGGKYKTPHGLDNAILLPGVLRFAAAETAPKLAALALRAGMGVLHDGQATLAARFLDGVEALNRSVGIPTHLAALQAADIPALAAAACWEADTQYPVARRMTQDSCEALLHAVLPPQPPSPHAPKPSMLAAGLRPRRATMGHEQAP